jgi:methylenetetrahydrofolate dehydrogenase (NADP+)/methenyltetrahydrofolate cyclohydrolase
MIEAMPLIDGNAIARAVLDDLKEEVATLPVQPSVVFIRVGEDPASVSYVRKKEKTAQALGIKSQLILPAETITQEELLAEVDRLNEDPSVHGILVQSPLPPGIDETTVFNRVAPDKDVDGFNVINVGRVAQDDPSAFLSCTPAGIYEILRREGVDTSGQHIVVVGRSQIVGKPAALLGLRKGPGGNATVTVCHSRTTDLGTITRQADILIAAVGIPRIVTGNMIKAGAVVIDVGINRVDDPSAKRGYRLVGDVEFESAEPVASRITPVPGGVGPMTVAMLMKNTVKAARRASS